MTRARPPVRGAPFALLLIHVFACGAAVTRVAHHVFGSFDGGVEIPDLVPPHAGPARASLLVVAYAAAAAALYFRPPGAWGYLVVLTAVQAVVAMIEGIVPLLSAVIALLLTRASTRRSRTGQVERVVTTPSATGDRAAGP